MTELGTLLIKGGPVMYPIIGVSVLLYARCCSLILFLATARRRAFHPRRGALNLATVRQLLLDLPETYRQQRLAIRVLIAAAPLLGLLGTVMGMIETFESLGNRHAGRSMAGLASGVSQALITTETGLAVVLPAMLGLYLAHRQLQRSVRQLLEIEAQLSEER